MVRNAEWVKPAMGASSSGVSRVLFFIVNISDRV